jgi:type IV pilus assembly protein PilZ
VSKPPGNERRSETRAPVEIDVDLATYERYYLSRLENVSIGGAFIRTSEPHPVGTEVKLRFQLPGTTSAIEAAGTVVWVYRQSGTRKPNSTGFGVRFTRIADDDRDKIAAYIASTAGR